MTASSSFSSFSHWLYCNSPILFVIYYCPSSLGPVSIVRPGCCFSLLVIVSIHSICCCCCAHSLLAFTFRFSVFFLFFILIFFFFLSACPLTTQGLLYPSVCTRPTFGLLQLWSFVTVWHTHTNNSHCLCGSECTVHVDKCLPLSPLPLLCVYILINRKWSVVQSKQTDQQCVDQIESPIELYAAELGYCATVASIAAASILSFFLLFPSNGFLLKQQLNILKF